MVNIIEIVNKLPIGTKLYSTICGECTIKKIYEGLGFDVISKDGTTYNFSYDGRFDLNGECCIFPSKENRDWSSVNIKVEISFEPKIGKNNYKIATFSPYDLKPFDKILVRSWGRWGISHFGYFDNGIVYTDNEKWYKVNVLPYNDETKHLLGTCDDYNGFYKWWD